MGDRGNIKVGKIYLYTHWDGSNLKKILKRVLKRKQRWNDEPYLTRMIFSEMIKDNVLGETEYGISTEIVDNDNEILNIDCKKQEVNGISFDEFIGVRA